MGRILLIALIVGLLSSCSSSQPTTSENASSETNLREEAISLEEGLASEEEGTEPTSSAGTAADNTKPTGSTPDSPAIGTSGMVSSAHPLATQAGLEILSEGGNAFDETVAVGAALVVVEPMMSSVGGYGAIVVHDAESGQTRVLDSASRAPAMLDPAVFHPPTPSYVENRRSAKAASTPGMANVWETLSNDHGVLEWRRLFDLAIKLAGEGFTIGERTADFIETEFSAFPEHAKSVYGNDGAPLRAGETLVQKDLAKSLGLIYEDGARVVTSGELGEAIDVTMREEGGFLTLDDLRKNRAR